MTLIELLIAMIVLVILLGATVSILPLYISTSSQVIAYDANIQQVISAQVAVQQLFAEEVAPGPITTSATGWAVLQPPVSPTSGQSSMSFYAATGNPDGPSLVAATVEPDPVTVPHGANGDTCLPATTAGVEGGQPACPKNLRWTIEAPNPGTCPTTANLAANPGVTLTCAYGKEPVKTVVSFHNVVNLYGEQMCYDPAFLYATGDQYGLEQSTQVFDTCIPPGVYDNPAQPYLGFPQAMLGGGSFDINFWQNGGTYCSQMQVGTTQETPITVSGAFNPYVFLCPQEIASGFTMHLQIWEPGIPLYNDYISAFRQSDTSWLYTPAVG